MFGSNRPAGVMVPENTSTEQAPQKRITNFSWCQFAAVEYGDATGRKHTTILMKMGDQWLMAPNGEAWAAQLRPAAAWFIDELKAAAARLMPPSGEATVDNVDVVPGGG